MRFQRIFVALLVVTLAAVVTAPVSADFEIYMTSLSGDHEVPPSDTFARGHATVIQSADGTELEFRLMVVLIEDVTAAHIHLGPPGENGPVVALLYSGAPDGSFSGILAEGTITAANLSGPLAGQPLSALIDEIEAGNAYVNVHTSDFPGGEIRGQL